MALHLRTDLNSQAGTIDHVRDEHIHELFPEFAPWIETKVVFEAAFDLSRFPTSIVEAVVESIPPFKESPECGKLPGWRIC